MTLPTRPAPAPPGSRAQFAAANANASLEQLRLQLQQQQQLQRSQQNVIVPNPLCACNELGDDSPFDNLAGSTGGGVMSTRPQIQLNGNYKKQPPPRPPPPKVLPKKGAAPTPPMQQSTNLLTNIFHLKKKSSRAPTSNNAPSRVYGSATYGTTTSSSSKTLMKTSTTNNGYLTSSSLSTDWNSAWNTTTTNYNSSAMQAAQQTTITEAQLISFDSPPSSPTFTQKSNSDCLSVDSFSSDSNFSSLNNGSVSQPESGFEDDFSARSRPATTSPLDPWETLDAFGHTDTIATSTSGTTFQPRYGSIGTAPVRNLCTINTRIQTNSDNPLCNGKSLLPPAPALNMPTIIKPKISQKPKAPKPPPILAKPTMLGSSYIYSDNLITPPSPPMPQSAPPPPPTTSAITSTSSFPASTQKPSILDVITGKVSAEWFKGRTRSGCEGIFPINYIEIKVPLASNSASNATNSSKSHSTSITPTYHQATATGSSELKVRSLYNFPAEVEGDLELKENDLVTILYRINEDWLYGEVNGRQGQFPANFLEYVPSYIPMP
ncbi:SH3 domain-containing protein 19 [Eumeta japonica]|uniref:SH3 domain-containing protein 19 n=1 Tax=Eumeta variegata TaxID=151549 RepID=A0A4C1SRL8_EUMVA|nr:SH3 domain-containing protein 19 [Eumeta japonica]